MGHTCVRTHKLAARRPSRGLERRVECGRWSGRRIRYQRKYCRWGGLVSDSNEKGEETGRGRENEGVNR